MRTSPSHERLLAAMRFEAEFSLMNFILCLAHTSQHHLANLFYPGWANQINPASDML